MIVHLVEMGGRGGVHQHAASVGHDLADAGVGVVLHTAHDAEELGDGVARCGCLRWSRRAPRGVRQAVTAIRFVGRTCPHLLRTVRAGDVVHVQGLFGYWLTAGLVWCLRRMGRPVVVTPHNTFARSGARRHTLVVRWIVSRADAVIVFTDSDLRRIEEWGGQAVRCELSMYHPAPDEARVRQWRQRYGGDRTALLAGYVRADKQPGLFLRACARLGVTAAVVGPAGDGEPDLATAGHLGVRLVREARYLGIEDFVAAIAAADVVVAVHARGSASAPLAIARRLGVRTAALAVGGVAEGALAVANEATPDAIADAVAEALQADPPPPAAARDVAECHLDAYAMAATR